MLAFARYLGLLESCVSRLLERWQSLVDSRLFQREGELDTAPLEHIHMEVKVLGTVVPEHTKHIEVEAVGTGQTHKAEATGFELEATAKFCSLHC